MSIVNQINKSGTVHDIGATYDNLDNKITETYATKVALTALQESIEASLAEINEKLANLEGYHTSGELDS
jgi:predicted nuclease with TOPRIM domain